MSNVQHPEPYHSFSSDYGRKMRAIERPCTKELELLTGK